MDGGDGTSRVLGVSCWLPPSPASVPESWSSWLQSWVLSFNQLLNNVRYHGHGGLRTNRYWIWKDRQREAQAQIWDDPRGYYFCNIIAIRPEAQGKGIGRQLFEAVSERADREGIKCYLESSKLTPNTQIYERLGFYMARGMECRDGEDVCMVSYQFLKTRPGCFIIFRSSISPIFSCIAWCATRGLGKNGVPDIRN